MENVEIISPTVLMDGLETDCDNAYLLQTASEIEGRTSVHFTGKNSMTVKPAYEVEEDFVFEEFSFFLHKTKGALMMLIRYEDFDVDFDNEDEQNYSRGALRVHGFKPNSRAEQQGLIKVNDEILSVNSVDLEGQDLEALVNALAKISMVTDPSGDLDSVLVRVRRKV
jgi:uncharacterized protein YdgA (DUF945 family)